MNINKGQIRLSTRKKNLSFEWKRGKEHFFSYIANRLRWHLYPRFHYVSKFPDHVDIEISSACNLRCPMCYTITDEFKNKVKIGLMDFELFKKLIDECSKRGSYSIRISLRGESFIHPNVFEMIEYAKKSGIKEVSSLTHGGMLDEDKFRRLIDIGLDWLTISFDGMEETYDKIRAPNKYNEMIKKIKRFSDIKKELKKQKPIIKVQSILPAISDDPKKFFNTFDPITDQIGANPLIDFSHSNNDVEFLENFTCPVLWQRLVIGSDGRVLLCSQDEMGSYIVGDVNKESIYEIWHGKKLQDARKIHLEKMGVKKLPPCKWCIYPRKTSPNNFLLGDRVVSSYEYVNWKNKVDKTSEKYPKK